MVSYCSAEGLKRFFLECRVIFQKTRVSLSFRMNLEEQEMWRCDFWTLEVPRPLAAMRQVPPVPMAVAGMTNGWSNAKMSENDQLFCFSNLTIGSITLLCSGYVVPMDHHGAVDEYIFVHNWWFASFDCTTCCLDNSFVSQWQWFSQTWKSATMKIYEIDPIS